MPSLCVSVTHPPQKRLTRVILNYHLFKTLARYTVKCSGCYELEALLVLRAFWIILICAPSLGGIKTGRKNIENLMFVCVWKNWGFSGLVNYLDWSTVLKWQRCDNCMNCVLQKNIALVQYVTKHRTISLFFERAVRLVSENRKGLWWVPAWQGRNMRMLD